MPGVIFPMNGLIFCVRNGRMSKMLQLINLHIYLLLTYLHTYLTLNLQFYHKMLNLHG